MRERYLSDSVSTASPGRLLVMLYERLVLDLSKAELALRDSAAHMSAAHMSAANMSAANSSDARTNENKVAAERLLHAQEIVLELNASLDASSWAGAAGLSQIYGYLLSELITANVNRDAEKVKACRELVEPLLDAWRQAAAAAQEPAPSRAG